MKKIYKAPVTDTESLNYIGFLAASRPGHQSATIFDETEVGSDIGNDGDTGDAKASSIWDDWTAEGEEEE